MRMIKLYFFNTCSVQLRRSCQYTLFFYNQVSKFLRHIFVFYKQVCWTYTFAFWHHQIQIVNQYTINFLLSFQFKFFDISSDNFKCISAQNDGITYLTEDTETQTIYRGILTFSNLVEQL